MDETTTYLAALDAEVNRLMEEAQEDAGQALILAAATILELSTLVSSGFTRACPYATTFEPREPVPPVE